MKNKDKFNCIEAVLWENAAAFPGKTAVASSKFAETELGIELGIKLTAQQLAHEADSFDKYYDKMAELIDFQYDNNTDALVVCGTTGENATMTQ